MDVNTSDITSLLDIEEPEISSRQSRKNTNHPRHRFWKPPSKQIALRMHNKHQKSRDVSRRRERDTKLEDASEGLAMESHSHSRTTYTIRRRDGPKSDMRRRMKAAAKIQAHKALCSGFLSGLKLSRATAQPRRPFYGLTENGATTLTTSGNPLVDFFFQVLPDSFPADVKEHLSSAWDHEPLAALRLLFQLRDIRAGKGDRSQFYECIDWMAETHPQTLLANLEWFPRYGYWKDLLMFVLRQLEGEEARIKRSQELAGIQARRDANNLRITEHKILRYMKVGSDFNVQTRTKKRLRRQAVDPKTGKSHRQKMIEQNLAAGQTLKALAHERRVTERAARAELIAGKLASDPIFAAFYDRVAELFAHQLSEDLVEMQKGSTEVTLCAKWAPRLGGSFDRRAHLGRAIAKKMFPNQTLRDWNGVETEIVESKTSEEELSCRIACEKYSKEVCVPLRAYLECPEVKMSARRWNEVKYERTPSVCMAMNAKHFYYNDMERFTEYLMDVAAGRKKIASGAVMPHDLVRAALEQHSQVTELQFRSIIRNLREAGSFSNSLAICDVSGSMAGRPMDVAVALSMILADLNTGTWHGRMVTFSTRPQFFVVPEGTLHEQVTACRAMDWGGSTNYHAVFNLIRRHAVERRMSPADMIKRLYVFSDMEFDTSGGQQFETTHNQIKREYAADGFEVPQIVFWNLRSRESKATPASASEKGVTLVSGYSAALLKIFMDGALADCTMESGGASEEVLDAVLTSERYQNIVCIVD